MARRDRLCGCGGSDRIRDSDDAMKWACSDFDGPNGCWWVPSNANGGRFGSYTKAPAPRESAAWRDDR